MVAKSAIVGELGAEGVLLPALIDDALRANEHAKYYFALLQEARAHADAPSVASNDLRAERLAAGLADASLDGVVAGAGRIAEGQYRVPQADAIIRGIHVALETMILPLPPEEATAFRSRLAALAPDGAGQDTVAGDLIDRMTSGDRSAGDSLHLLVMDLHKALNRLQAGLATETIDGAAAYGLGDADRALVRRFMAGLHRTAWVKFAHPGLATTATAAAGGRLLIQNDIGTTDAHVLMLTIEGLNARVTYTDIHGERLAFFQRMFEPFGVMWSSAERRRSAQMETGGYQLSVGTYAARDGEALARFVEFLGARIVFLIDWNRARKRLRPFVARADAVAVLDWAAVNEVGHCGFLGIGGDAALFEAMEFASAGRLHLGDRLADVLGSERAIAYLKFVFEAAARGLAAGRSPSLIKDEIKVELRSCFETGHQRLLTLASRHASYVQEIASAVFAALLRQPSEGAESDLEALAARAAGWERRADDLLNQARAEARQAHAPAAQRQFLERADDAADALEEAAFLLTLVGRHRCGVAIDAASPLAALLDEDTRAFVSALECARHLGRTAPREDLDDFLTSVDRVFCIEHSADAALREASRRIVAEAEDFRALHLATQLAATLEDASDALAHSAQLLRTYMIEEVMQT